MTLRETVNVNESDPPARRAHPAAPPSPTTAGRTEEFMDSTRNGPAGGRRTCPVADDVFAGLERRPGPPARDADWEQRLHGLGEETSVQSEGAAMYRVLTSEGTRTTTELVEMSVRSGVRIRSLTVQNTTLDDVFVHYTGRQLRDELVKPLGFVMPPRPGMQP